MKLFDPSERVTAEAVTAISATNPFRPERIRLERTILGDAYRGEERVRAQTPAGIASRSILLEP